MDRYRGRLAHMVEVAAEAGFAGFEPETVMLPADWSAASLDTVLGSNGLDLAALCLVDAWQSSSESEAEKAHADRVIDAVRRTPGAIINLVHAPGADRSDLRARQTNALACMRDIAIRAASVGVVCSFHPNSPPGSVFRLPDDYDVMLNELDPLIGYTPDTGHLVAGGMDPLAIIRRHRDRVKYVHIKDASAGGGWAPTGDGVVDIPGIANYLAETGYDGWLTFEDESPLAERDPDGAVARAGEYIQRTFGNGRLST